MAHRFASRLLAAAVTASLLVCAHGAGATSVRVGNAEFTPGGALDLSTIVRSRNTGNSSATSFSAIPYDNTVQGHLSELRMTAQTSKLNLKVTDVFGRTSVLAYFEGDFSGNSASNLFVSSNSHTFRLKHYWADVEHGNWELLAGQTWSWITPNRKGLSMDPGNTFVTRNLDVSTQVGLAWTRAAQLRVAYHPSDDFGLGVALENPEPYLGAGEVILPFAYNAQLGPQFDAGNNPGAPGYLPDVLAKAAWDGGTAAQPIHLEVAGLQRWWRVAYLPVGSGTFDHAVANGLSGSVAASFTVNRKFRLVASAAQGDGVGRYLGGLGPDVTVKTNTAGTRISLETVFGQSFLFGFEAEPTPNDQLAAYFGRADFERTTSLDTTNPVPNRWAGFGGPNSPNSANHMLREFTIDASHTFWSSAEHGSFAVLAQLSQLYREPWFTASSGSAHTMLNMAYVNLRYTLP